MNSLYAMYGLPDSMGLNGMFLKQETEWVLQDKVTHEEDDVFIASVGPFKTPALFQYKRHDVVKADWAHLWERVMSQVIGFSVYLTESKDGTHIMGVRGEKKIHIHHCQKCGHEWSSSNPHPKSCPNGDCRSRTWDREEKGKAGRPKKKPSN